MSQSIRALAATCAVALVTAAPAFAAGQWTVVPSPSPSTAYNYLDGVTCTSVSDCWAAGSYESGGEGGPYYALMEHDDGSAWSQVKMPQHNGDELYAVACVGSDDCWAAGDTFSAGTYSGLIDHYDGHIWTTAASPLGPDSNSALRGLACPAQNDCWAVGLTFNTVPTTQFQTTGDALIEHWDGGAWSVTAAPTVVAELGDLQAVTCVTENNCWAVGYSDDGTVAPSLIEHYDGSQWATVSPPTNAAEESFLYGVTCSGASSCWAVGFDYTQDVANYQPLIDHYDGSSWSIASSQTNGTSEGNYLWGVTCAAGNDCWAVGDYCDCTNNNASGIVEAFMEHWDGASWSLAPTPVISSPQFGGSDLQAVACPAAANCVAAGYQWITGHPYVDQPTLIEQMVSAPGSGVPEWPNGPLALVVGLIVAAVAATRGRSRRAPQGPPVVSGVRSR